MRLLVLLTLCLLGPLSAAARPVLRPFPTQTLLGYAQTLRRGEIAVVETGAEGRARQITLLGYAEAPPDLVHALVADPTQYPRYVRNLTRSQVERRPDGTLLSHWRLSYPIGSFSGSDELHLLPGTPGAVEIWALGEQAQGIQRWEFLPAPDGGTVVVDYGYYDPLDNAVLRALIGTSPELDAGFNLAGGLSLLRGLLAEATRAARAQGQPPLPSAAGAQGSGDLGPLLARGTLALVRTDAAGHLIDTSVVERVPAPIAEVRALVRTPETWPRMLKSIHRVRVQRRDPQGISYEMDAAGFLFEVTTAYRTQFTEDGADTLAVGGTLRGARFRWDLSPEGPNATVVIWRGNLHIGDSSRLVRAMLRIEPSFEHSANVCVGLVSVRSLVRQLLRRGASP